MTRYQNTRQVEEALFRLTEAYMALGIVNEAQTAAAVLGYNFPDSPWYKDAYRLVQQAAWSRRKTRAPGSARRSRNSVSASSHALLPLDRDIVLIEKLDLVHE